MVWHVTDMSTALNSQFTNNWIVRWRLQREYAASIWFQTLYITAVQQFNTFKDLSRWDLQLQIAINANCHYHIHKLTHQLANEQRLYQLALDRIEELNSIVSFERGMELSTSNSRQQQWRSQSTINEPGSSSDSDSGIETSNQVSAADANDVASSGVLWCSLYQKSKRLNHILSRKHFIDGTFLDLLLSHMSVYVHQDASCSSPFLYKEEGSQMENYHYYSTTGISTYKKYFLEWVDSKFYLDNEAKWMIIYLDNYLSRTKEQEPM